MIDAASVASGFEGMFGEAPRVFSAPGRVNLIGEHTDYNDGVVLPIAIDRRTFVAASLRADKSIRAFSNTLQSQVTLDLSQRLCPQRDWANHIRGIATLLLRSGARLTGANLVIDSNVPVGAGLASSAALGVAVAYALTRLSGHSSDLVDLARLVQQAEHEFAGTNCGIMDQYVSCLGVAGHALLIDCRSLECRAVPAGRDDVEFIICDTQVRHDLASSEYNTRRAECEAGLKVLASTTGITSLRDATIEQLEEAKHLMDGNIYARCRHVITEIERTAVAATALEDGDFSRFGALMWQSHTSLRDDYEVSCPELDFCVEIASTAAGVYGSRMTGGGFGGCTISLVERGSMGAFEEAMKKGYQERWGLEPAVYRCHAANGVREERLSS